MSSYNTDQGLVVSTYVDNMKFYGDMRFKQLTLLLAWMTIIGVIFSNFNKFNFLQYFELYFLIISFFVITVLWIMEMSSNQCLAANKQTSITDPIHFNAWHNGNGSA